MLSLITFAYSLDPEQAQQNVRPDLDPNCLSSDTLMVLQKYFFEKADSEKKKIILEMLPSMLRVFNESCHKKTYLYHC